MSRLAMIDPASATGAVKTTLDAVNAALGVTPNVFHVAANSSATLRGLVQLNGSLASGTLDAGTREAIAIAVAQEDGCDYCLSAHAYLGKAAGLSDGDLFLARNAKASESKRNAVLRLADSILRNRGRLAVNELADAKISGISDEEIVEVVGHVALNVFTNYLNVLADTDIDFPVVRTAEISAA
jgi:uncharacterized peroxidase-related enzyme